eukprot:TRINITY_DN419_c0_g1_i1.p1 TRINITY_DN419_c0_g1~~TRINITY_DN419_c0_g1_i1.p1  ORF type:complete len:384 (+),score=23.18 TRINITY_DN419_c0_g1_i1:124-1275(+)
MHVSVNRFMHPSASLLSVVHHHYGAARSLATAVAPPAATVATAAHQGRTHPRPVPVRFHQYGGRPPTKMPPCVYHPDYSCEWPEKHRFPMRKFRDLFDVLTSGPEPLVDPADLFTAPEPEDHLFLMAHSPEYYNGFVDGTLTKEAMRRIGFPVPHSQGLIRRTRLEVSGTVLAVQLALEYGLACNLAGGTHHAHRDFGSGFTILNDLAVAARAAQAREGVGKICIVDADVHQGDGTAAIFTGDSSVHTTSFHCGDNFPFRKVTSDLDVAFPSGTGDAEFIPVFRETVRRVLAEQRPELVLYDAGVDMWEGDALGRLQLSEEGLLERDTIVMQVCLERGVPLTCVIGGGYDSDPLALARRHAIVFNAASRVWNEHGMALMPSWQ